MWVAATAPVDCLRSHELGLLPRHKEMALEVTPGEKSRRQSHVLDNMLMRKAEVRRGCTALVLSERFKMGDRNDLLDDMSYRAM